MKIHRLTSEQFLPIDLEKAWTFFSSPENLNRITPADMHFEILSGAEAKAYTGQLITYKIRPLMNIPMNWVTEITACEDFMYFIDEQRFGPYAFWHHQHHFEKVEGGVLMRDILHYALPGGWLGNIFGGPIVHPRVKEIFRYREQILNDLFPKG
ncbi:MAG: hypothetical protein GC193_12450 [Cryomorphaceae bacterium]|nr:hypothetical protein [Cryomorphaceae bacterium]